MRVVALLAAYNEERFIAACLEHYFAQGVEVYLINNGSTDRTVEIAQEYRHRGLIGIEHVPRAGVFRWRPLLERKEQLAQTLDADWFMHADPDEIRLPPRPGLTLAQALAEAQAAGYNAVNFMEFPFLPTQESPDHDHADFQRTLRWYYPFLPSYPHRLNAWQKQAGRVELAWSAGHQVRFPGLQMGPDSFPMRHYMFLSLPHALEKYLQRNYDPAAVRAGWHRRRASLTAASIRLPRQAEMRVYESDEKLDASRPLTRHLWSL